MAQTAEKPISAAALFQAVRNEFPGTIGKTYTNTAARGLLSWQSRTTLDAYLDQLSDGRVDKQANFDMIKRVREKFAQLIKAQPDEIAFTKNVSEGLNMIAGSLPWKAGDNVVLCRDVEHPNNIYPWLNLQRRFGVEVRSVPDREGAIDVEAMLDLIDDRTRLVTVATVTFAPGFRTDVETLGQVCREKDIFFLVDAVQSVGVVATDVEKLKVDGLAVSTQKGLCGLYGMGFLYCRRDWAERITPAALARFSVDLGPDVHEATMGDESYDLMAGARRFDLGNYNYPAAIAVEPSLDLLLDLGPPVIEDYVCGLSHRLAGGLHQLGLRVSGGPPGPHLAHTVTAGQYARNTHESAGDPESDALYKHLTENDVILTVRRGMLRFSLHLYNNEADVDRVLDLVREWQAEKKA
jgi:cysteine desulfurase/selenocysteine lyase